MARMAGEKNRVVDDIQDIAGWAGLLPHIGPVIDLVNAGVYGIRKKPGLAALTAIGAVPLGIAAFNHFNQGQFSDGVNG